MSDRTHCDLCDVVISDDERHLTATLGLWEGDEGTDEDAHRDFCGACVAKHPVLTAFLAEQLDLARKALEAIDDANHTSEDDAA